MVQKMLSHTYDGFYTVLEMEGWRFALLSLWDSNVTKGLEHALN